MLVMELATDAAGDPAPRLGEVDLTPEVAREYYAFLIRQMVGQALRSHSSLRRRRSRMLTLRSPNAIAYTTLWRRAKTRRSIVRTYLRSSDLQ
jgi:hypothetical protein